MKQDDEPRIHLRRRNKREYDWPIEQIRSWILEGRTHDWIAARYGVCSQLISKTCKRHGIQCHRTGPRAADGHPEWKGGRNLDKDGYVLIYAPNHPMARGSKKMYVLEHRLVMAQWIGRNLLKTEVVHHKNGIHDDNRIENLVLYPTNGDHLRDELTGRCPKWSKDGKARILAALRSRKRSRKGKQGLDG